MSRILLVLIGFSFCVSANSQSALTAQYLANEGVMVAHGETKVLFDPLYRNSYDTYQMLPEDMQAAIFAGEAPFDGIDAVFISHHHGDHFSAEDILHLLRQQTDIHLYAPAQAVAAMRDITTSEDDIIFDRVRGFALEYGDAPMFVRKDDLLVEAVRIPHSGWPGSRTDVENIAFRVTLNDKGTVVHLGDADSRIVHFASDEAYWEERETHLAFPPYWFFQSDDGREILDERISAQHSIGVHVPAEFADDASGVPDDLQEYDLFTRPGEGRRFK